MPDNVLHAAGTKVADAVKQDHRMVGFIHLINFSMPEMAHAGNYHCKVVLYAIINTVFISYRTAGFDECFYTCFMRHLHAIIKRKKGVACQYSAMQIEIELPGFFNRLFQRIYTT